MNTQPEALRLADWLENEPGYDWNRNYCLAVAELRRLHEVNQMLVEAAEMALEALKTADKKIIAGGIESDARLQMKNAIIALRQALKQQDDIEKAVAAENEACAKIAETECCKCADAAAAIRERMK